MKPKALIIGGSRGLGEALLNIYKNKGWETHNISRNTCDLSDPLAVEKLAGDMAFINSGFTLGIFSAATADMGYIDETSPQAFRHCMQVNFLSLITLFYALAKADHPCRRFIFIHSGAADFLIPGFSPYAISKRALRDYLYIAKLENSFPGCQILQVWPGGIATEFTQKIRFHGSYKIIKGMRPRTAFEVASRIYEAEQSGKGHLNLSSLFIFLGRMQSFLPGLLNWLMQRHPLFRRKP